VDESGDKPNTVTVHGPGEFTGDVGQVTGRPAIVSAVARADGAAYEVSPDALREMLNNHPDLGDLVMRAFIARRQLLTASGRFTGLRVIGSRYSRDTFRVREFLAENHVPYTWLDLEDASQVRQLLKQFEVGEADAPVVAWGRKPLLRNPSNRALAEGFPTGITGAELAGRAVLQANKFGAQLPIATPVTRVAFDDGYTVLHLDGGEAVTGKCLLIATGADYRRLGVEGCEPLEGRGVYYAATPTEAHL
jgi:thioredoxin reductase (NADPH)